MHGRDTKHKALACRAARQMACCYCTGGWICSSSMGSHVLVSFSLRAHCSLLRVLLRTLCPCWSSNTLPPCPCGHRQPFPTSQSEPFYKIMNQIMWLACLSLPVAATILRKTKTNNKKNPKKLWLQLFIFCC